MIPLRDDNPARTTPYVLYGLIAANILVFIMQLSGQLSNLTLIPYSAVHDIRGYLLPLAYQGHRVFQLTPGVGPHPQWLTIFSSMFMHASIQHIGFNMLYLFIFGNNIEDALGHVKFLFFYLLCGALATVAHAYVSGGFASAVPVHAPGLDNAVALKAMSAGIPTLGASGAIAGVLGAYIVLFPRTKVRTLVMLGWFWDTVDLPAIYLLGVWFLLQLIPGMGGQVGGGVAYWAHIGGFIVGALIILIMGKNRILRNRTPLRRPWNEDRPYPFRPWR